MTLTFSEDDLIELELYRDQEIDALVEAGLLDQESRWAPENRDVLTFKHPELVLTIHTGSTYPVKCLTYQVVNLALPREVVDKLRVSLRTMLDGDEEEQNFRVWEQRHGSLDTEFEPAKRALQLAMETLRQISIYRSQQKPNISHRHDGDISLRRREILHDYYGYRGLISYGHLDPRKVLDEEQWKEAAISNDPLRPVTLPGTAAAHDLRKLKIDEVQTEADILTSAFGIDPSSIIGNVKLNNLLQQTPQQICERIPETWRILHVESVVRGDRLAAFEAARSHIRLDLARFQTNQLLSCVGSEARKRLGKRQCEREILIDELTRPKITFHCTREDNVPSIIKYGFLAPRDEEEVRCGSTYGRGIYSSPDPEFALMYTDCRVKSAKRAKAGDFAGSKLIACAIIPGRTAYMTRDDEWRKKDQPFPGSHSHAANDMLEYVVFNEAQILPCYVIHVDLGREAAQFLAAQQADEDAYRATVLGRMRTEWARKVRKIGEIDGPGDRQRKKEALVAQAKKFFAYGYGPIAGNKIQVLEVGEVSDDEEDYGDYQRDRVDGNDDSQVFDIWAGEDSGLGWDPEAVAESGADEGPSVHDMDTVSAEAAIVLSVNEAPGRTKLDEYHAARVAKIKKGHNHELQKWR